VAVAAAVASGAADAGLGIQAAAAQFNLGFVPLYDEAYYLVCLKAALDDAAIVRLRGLLGSAAWAAAVGSLAGCEVAADAGRVLALTQALPWWHYRRPRTQAVARG
jgi:putative molybdopterin biosynthesis protein